MVTIYGLVLIAVFCTWAVLSVGFQYKDARVVVLKQYDYFSLLPLWTFFAPRPGVFDTRLVFRDKLINGELSVWREIPLPESRYFRFVWNPQKRARKTLSDLSSHLLALHNNNPTRKNICLSMPYITLVTFVAALSRSALSELTQFAIVKTHGYWGSASGAIRIVFLSEFHSVR